MSCNHSRFNLEHQVRHGTRPDSPGHLHAWLEVAQECAQSLPLEARRRLYIHVFNVLSATMTDRRVDRQWRLLCLDHACMPLCRLRPLCVTEQQRQELMQLRHRLAHIGRFMI